jgi:hypothetical protein
MDASLVSRSPVAIRFAPGFLGITSHEYHAGRSRSHVSQEALERIPLGNPLSVLQSQISPGASGAVHAVGSLGHNHPEIECDIRANWLSMVLLRAISTTLVLRRWCMGLLLTVRVAKSVGRSCNQLHSAINCTARRGQRKLKWRDSSQDHPLGKTCHTFSANAPPNCDKPSRQSRIAQTIATCYCGC